MIFVTLFFKASLTVHEESCRASLEVLSRPPEVDEQGVSGRVPLSHPLRMIHNNTVCLVLKRNIKCERNQTKVCIVPDGPGRFVPHGSEPLSSLDESLSHLSEARLPQDPAEDPRGVFC